MVKRDDFTIKQFLGVKNDEDSKQIPPEYFFRLKNFNFPITGTQGLDKILNPERVLQFDDANIDGAFEYRFLDENNVLQKQNIVFNNGKIFETDLISTKTELKTGLTAGLVSVVVFREKLFIANGKDHIQVYYGAQGIVSEMGAPLAEEGTGGTPNGTYYYAMTYVTAAGEEVIGSVSNTLTVANKRIDLTLPIGYNGTTSRKIYRTVTSGTQLKLVTTVADNTTLTFTDNVADASLGADIIPLNNELPKAYLLSVAQQKLYATKADIFPTQAFVTGTNIEVIDVANFIDISNYSTDNTPVVGIGEDFNKIIIGSEKNIFMIDPSDDSVIVTRANVGMKSGYSVVKVPKEGDFLGGLMFVSSLNDVRIMSGIEGTAVGTTIDNVRTENWAQNIRGDLETELKVLNNIYAVFLDYRYTLVINSTKFIFDIRVQKWTEHEIRSASFTSTPLILAVINGLLYNGQDNGWIEREYADILYRTEEVVGILESPHIAVNEKYKFIENLKYWFKPTNRNKIVLDITTDDNAKFTQSNTFSMDGGVFTSTNFGSNFFDVDLAGMDYRTVNVNRTCRWIKYVLSITEGNISFQQWTLVGQQLTNRE